MKDSLNIIIAGGGTGGHLFPGIAIGDAFKAENRHSQIVFVSTGRPFETGVLSKAGYPHIRITSEGLKGRGLRHQMIAMFKILPGIWESIRIIKKFRPDMIIGVGGYSSGPVVIAAWLSGIPAVIHEQNTLPGITNRILSHFVRRIFISFEITGTFFKSGKVILSGNPVRKTFFESGQKNTKDGSMAGRFIVLIAGGSQGARGINNAMKEASAHIKIKDKLFIIHQTGEQDKDEVERVYNSHNIAHIVRPFFHDMAHQYRLADLVICRAGATTIAEITVMGKAAVFIPFPFAADDHQTLNARYLADAGAARIIPESELNGRILAETIEHFASNPNLTADMALNARHLSSPDAAQNIVNQCRNLV